MRDERGLIYSYHSSLRINNNNLLLRFFIEKKRSSLEPSLGGGGGFLFISPRTPVKKKSKKSARLNFRVHPQTQKRRRRRRSEKTDKISKSSYICTRERPFVLNICARFYLSFCVYEKRKSACRKRRTVVIIVRGRKRVFHSRLRWIDFLLRFS